MADRIDTTHRRRLLADRHLLGGTGRSDRTVADVTHRLGLLHSTDPSTPFLSLHARAEVSGADIERAFYDDRAVLRHTTIRRTVFVMPLDVVPLAHHAFNGGLVGRLRRQLIEWIASSDDVDGPPEPFLDELEESVVERLRAGGPATGTALAKEIAGLRVVFEPAPGTSYSKPMRITSKVLELLAAEGRIARGRPTGADLTSGAWTWAPIDDWLLGGIPELDVEEARRRLVERHLRLVAPATVDDLAWWSGLPKRAIRTALDRLAVREVDLDEGPGAVLPDDDLELTRPAAELDTTVALLPGLDTTTMAWKRRGWYVDDDPAAGLFDRNGNAGPTVWVGGRVVGAWTQRDDGSVTVELLADVDADAHERLGAEAARIESWLGDARVRWRYPTPITKRLS